MQVDIADGDRDCSSACLSALLAAGIDINGASCTSDMVDCLVGTGNWTYESPDFIASPGDLYINPGEHVAMCLTQDPDVMMAFRENENGDYYGGAVGDQTGEESEEQPFTDFGIQGILHWTGDAHTILIAKLVMKHLVDCPRHGYTMDADGRWGNGETETITIDDGDDSTSTPSAPTTSTAFDRRDGFSGSGVTYQALTMEDKWLPEVHKADDTDDGYAGNDDHVIYAIKAKNDNGVPLTLTGHVCGQPEDQWLSPCTDNVTSEGDGYCGDAAVGPLDCFKISGANARGGAAGEKYFPPIVGGHTDDGDDYVGEFGKPLVDIQMWNS